MSHSGKARKVWVLIGSSLLFGGICTAQSNPDFSGVFVRTTDALILEITQSANILEVTSLQGGESNTRRFRLDGTPAINDYAGFQTKDVVQFKHGLLQLESTLLSAPAVRPAGLAPAFSVPGSTPWPTSVSETWEISPDRRSFTVQRKTHFVGGPSGGFNLIEAYRREASVDAALAGVASSAVSQCNISPLPYTIPMRAKPKAEPKKLKYEGADAPLGETELRQISRSVAFDADLSGDVFKGLERIRHTNGFEFIKAGKPISTYPDTVTLEVEPSEVPVDPYFPVILPGYWSHQLSPDLLSLRFQALWLGATERDLGEIDATLMTEPWTETSTPIRFYRMQVPSKDIPLNAELEIRIYKQDGTQLACIRNHI